MIRQSQHFELRAVVGQVDHIPFGRQELTIFSHQKQSTPFQRKVNVPTVVIESLRSRDLVSLL